MDVVEVDKCGIELLFVLLRFLCVCLCAWARMGVCACVSIRLHSKGAGRCLELQTTYLRPP